MSKTLCITLLSGDHVTAGNKKAITALIVRQLNSGKIGRTNYYLTHIAADDYDVVIVQNFEKWFGEGVKPHQSKSRIRLSYRGGE